MRRSPRNGGNTPHMQRKKEKAGKVLAKEEGKRRKPRDVIIFQESISQKCC